MTMFERADQCFPRHPKICRPFTVEHLMALSHVNASLASLDKYEP